MQRTTMLCSVTALLAVAATGLTIPAAQAQAGSVKTIFEKYNLLGTSARDCSRPASQDNPYYITRLVDANHVQRDEMRGPTTRTWFALLDRAAEVRANQIGVGGRLTGVLGSQSVEGEAVEAVWRVEGNRVQTVELSRAGKKMVANARLVGNGQEVWWTHRCDTAAK